MANNDTDVPETKKERMGAWKIILLVVVGLFVIGSLLPEPTPEDLAAMEAAKREEEKAEMAAKAAEAQARIDQAVPVTAVELAQAYEANEAAAQMKYGDKLLLVSGTVTGVDLNLTDDPVVKLASENQFLDVSLFVEDKERAAMLTKGAEARAVCERIGEVIGTPQLGDCVLVN